MTWLSQANQVPSLELDKMASLLKDSLFFLMRLLVEIVVAYFVIRAAVSAALRDALGDRRFPPAQPPGPGAPDASFVVNDEDDAAEAPAAPTEDPRG
jgi:hypothetical protein